MRLIASVDQAYSRCLSIPSKRCITHVFLSKPSPPSRPLYPNYDANDLRGRAIAAALHVLDDEEVRRQFAARRVERAVRNMVIDELPRWSGLAEAWQQIQISVPNPLSAELNRLNALHQKHDLDSILARYAVRESSLLAAIARSLWLANTGEYESRVMKIISESSALRDCVRALLGPLQHELQ